MSRTLLAAAVFVALSATASSARAGTLAGACSSADDGALGSFAMTIESAAASPGTASAAELVDGKALAMNERFWLDWTATIVFPTLPADMQCDAKVDMMAHVFWWALKEGNLGSPSPPSYSNCMDDGKRHAWNFVCPGMWQVGFGVQVWDHPMSEVRRAVERTYGTEEDALRAAYFASDLELQGVSWKKFLAANQNNSRLRRSWLERAPAVGFVLEDPDVVNGCVDDAKGWCHAPESRGNSWLEADRYGATMADSRRAIGDTRALFAQKTPCE